jgi:hypothetical protein
MTTNQFKTHVKETLTSEGWEIITEFFIAFARFECALKKSGYTNGGNYFVTPNWDRFISSIRTNYNKTKPNGLSDAIDYIINQPPRIQILFDGKLDWRPRIFKSGDDEIAKLKQSICDIRNNLFHGGKFQGNYEEDISRNFILLNHSITILNFWLTLDDNLNQKFSEPLAY